MACLAPRHPEHAGGPPPYLRHRMADPASKTHFYENRPRLSPHRDLIRSTLLAASPGTLLCNLFRFARRNDDEPTHPLTVPRAPHVLESRRVRAPCRYP